jgi:subtilisin family serine protease
MWSRRNGQGRTRALGAVTVAVTAVVTCSTAAQAGEEDAAQASAAEYVVSFTGSPDGATAAIEAAGGAVRDVTEQVGLALVTAPDATFPDRVQGRPGVLGVARNHAVGTERPGMPHRFAEERPSYADLAGGADGDDRGPQATGAQAEPLADRQWDMAMIGATPDGAHRVATGRGVDVGIIDTGIDGAHPDIAPNFDADRSVNFTTDIPALDGPCEVPSCVDPADADDEGHGTHVAGTVAAAVNGFGIGGVAPDATLVDVRAGQDSGFFFLYETVRALVYAGDIGLDVVNMSFYTDPWQFNCTSRDEYVEGEVTDAELTEQRLVHDLVLQAVAYAVGQGVTLVAAEGNSAVDMAAPTRVDTVSPDNPPGAARPRTVANTCLDLPAEAPQVISVSAVGPSTTKADYSNYGLGDVEVAAPGGWFSDLVGTPAFRTPENLVLSTFPVAAAIAQGLADPDGRPVDARSVQYCDEASGCGFYTSLQGTSMAAPHVTGVAALVVERYGTEDGDGGRSLAPAEVARIIAASATDHPCPAGGIEDYTDEGAPPEVNAVCQGTPEYNGLYGEGIVDAAAAVAGP